MNRAIICAGLTSATSAPAVHELQQLGVDGLPGLLQHPDELAGLPDVAGGEEGVGRALVGAAGRAPDAVDVVLRRVGVVVVDDELDVLHVWTAAGFWREGGVGGDRDVKSESEETPVLAR